MEEKVRILKSYISKYMTKSLQLFHRFFVYRDWKYPLLYGVIYVLYNVLQQNRGMSSFFCINFATFATIFYPGLAHFSLQEFQNFNKCTFLLLLEIQGALRPSF